MRIKTHEILLHSNNLWAYFFYAVKNAPPPIPNQPDQYTMKINCQISFVALSVCLLAACSPNYYIPNTQNVPVIGAKGETNISVAGNGNQFELQGAVGVSDNIALQLNGGYVFPKNEDNGNGGSGKLIEGGVGYFTNISDNLLFDVYALAGVGSMENHFPGSVSANPSTTGKISANLARFALQPALTFHSNYFSISGSARIGSLNFSNIDGNLIFDGVDQTKYLTDNKSNFLIEPALTLRGGIEKIKLQIQLMKSINVSESDFRQDDAMLSVGLNFRL